ncbi:MAG: hypothetical protein D3906_09425 [Candidatus Electrothrix sp. AUS1_2]|nr:hypothetical protein [Candidatus Electrothrix sp. AUS1_2]
MPSLLQEDQEPLKRPNRRPDLKKRAESILSIAEDDGEGIVKADEAEDRVIEEVRRTGNEVITGRGESRIGKSRARTFRRTGILSAAVKKNPMAHDIRCNFGIRAGIQAARKTFPPVQPERRNNLPALFPAAAACRDRLRSVPRLRPCS